MSRIILVLDDVSRKYVKVDNSVINAGSITVAGSIFDINESNMLDVSTIVILEGIMQDVGIVARVKMLQWVFGVNFVMLCAEEPSIFDKFCSVYQCDISVIDNELIHAAVFGDVDRVQEVDSLFRGPEHFAKAVLEDSAAKSDVKSLAKAFLGAIEQNSELSESNKALQDRVSDLEGRNKTLVAENTRWSKGCAEIVKRIAKLNESLARYEQIFSKDIYTKFHLRDFKNRPTIIYLKEYTDFIGRDLLVETIVDALRIQKGLSTKVLCLFDSENSRKVKILPEYYTVLRNNYSLEEVVQSMYLCKTGNYSSLLEKLLSNRYSLDVLIIVDCKDYEDTVLVGDFLQYSLCRCKDFVKRFGLPHSNAIVNDKDDDWLNWQEPDLSQLTKSEAFVKLSSRKVVCDVLSRSGPQYYTIV